MSGWRRGTLRGGGAACRPLVVKLGGSLLVRPAWDRDVARLLDGIPAPRLLVVGGGPLVDGLRAVDGAVPLPPALVHRLAIDCMGQTARLVAAALDIPLVAEPGADGPPTAVLDAPRWLDHAGRLARLPVGWEVTSDSIAALVAATHAAGLLLAKSVAPPHDDVDQAAAAGWVDDHFPTAARDLAWIGWAAVESVPPTTGGRRP